MTLDPRHHENALKTRFFWSLALSMLIVSACSSEVDERPQPWVIGADGAGEEEREIERTSEGVENLPEAACEPQCAPGACGEDGCGGSCGPCGVLAPFCFAGFCQNEAPNKEPTLEINPLLVDFGTVSGEQEAVRFVTLRSVGKEALEIHRFGISGDGDFVVMQEEQAWRSTSGNEVLVELNAPWRLEAGETRDIEVRYTPLGKSAGQAALRLLSNDPSAPEGHLILLRGGPPVGCISWSTESLDFGATIYGTKSDQSVQLLNCGTTTLSIESLDISGDSAGAFTLSEEAPESLEPGETWETSVSYAPTAGSVGALGSLDVNVSWSGGTSSASISLTGFVVVEDCPVAMVDISEQSPVAPGTIVHLSGLESYSPVNTVAEYTWSSEEPPGGLGSFHPNQSSPSPTFSAMLAGKYHFNLEVKDSEGKQSCVPASTMIRVAPEHALYIELTWFTPGDPDPYDQGFAAGPDLDLHLSHPDAEGQDLDGDGEAEPWFDPTFDCYWFNASPDWGPFSPPTDDDPHLTIEDVDGGGPEAIGFDIPESGASYRIAVHAWQDHGFGPSIATVRVYLLGDQIFQSQAVPLVMNDLWEVAEVTWLGWPEASVEALAGFNGGPRIYPNASP